MIAGERTMLELADRVVQVERGGDGPPVLYLHGALGEGYWNPFTDALAANGFDVVVPAHPGYWDSTRPEWIQTVDDLAFHYVDVMDALGLARTAVVGSSLGGWIATVLAILRPERITAMALVAPLGVRSSREAPDLFALQPAEAVEVLFADRDVEVARLMASIDLDDPPDEELVLPLLQTLEASARYAWWPSDPRLEGRLRFARSVPTLVLWGTGDAFADGRLSEAYREHMDARLEYLEGAGHMAALERPEETAAAVAAFLSTGGHYGPLP